MTGRAAVDEDKLRSILTLAGDFVDLGPLGYGRWLLALTRMIGAKSISYHLSSRALDNETARSFKLFASRNAISSRNQPEEIRVAISRCHDDVLVAGFPVALSNVVPKYLEIDRALTERVMALVAGLGVADEFMIPVYGPFGVNAIVSFGFEKNVPDECQEMLKSVALVLPSTHCALVRMFFPAEQEKIDLSGREHEVLNWIMLGKSRSQIAQIMDLSQASIDTYTRRLFKKLGVNDRVSAAVAAFRRNLVT